MSVAQILRGAIPPVIADEHRRKYRRDFWHAHPEYKARDVERKAERYAADPDFREQRKAAERERRASMTAEQRAADNARRKARMIKLSPEEYERRLNAAAERCRRWRQKQKEKRNG